jgi:spore coat polysaccharide biosynthesis protein SpsF
MSSKIVSIIQARTGSKRLPGKVLKDIGGQTMLARVVLRTQRAAFLDEVVVATTVEAADQAIVAECKRLRVPVFRGDAQDVLDRYYRAVLFTDAKAIVRITADCPLIDPKIIDQVVGAFLDAGPDYASNVLKRSYPRGLDTEVFTFAALETAWKLATDEFQRVHVTPFIYQNPNLFKLLSVTHTSDLSDHRWTVDTPEDLAFVRAVYQRLGDVESITWQQVLRLLSREPSLKELNQTVRQKHLREG